MRTGHGLLYHALLSALFQIMDSLSPVRRQALAINEILIDIKK